MCRIKGIPFPRHARFWREEHLCWSANRSKGLSDLSTERLQIVIPVVLVIIFVMLYMTYHSAKEALHVLLVVPQSRKRRNV
jgi:hypothetical protein